MAGSGALQAIREVLRCMVLIVPLMAAVAEDPDLRAAEKTQAHANPRAKNKGARKQALGAAKDPGGEAQRPASPDSSRTDRQVAPNSQVVGYSGEYRIGPGDVLQINVWKEPEMSIAGVAVRPDGKISMLLIGEISVRGLSPVNLEELITAKYADYIKGARVSVLVKEINSQKVYVIGEVKKEGAIRLQNPMTILQAIAEAGGLTDYARKKRIYVLRLEGYTQRSISFDYDAVIRGQKMEQNVLVAPGDTIIVPR